LTGFLHPPDAIDAMAQSAVELLSDQELHKGVAAAALEAVVQRFCSRVVVPEYEMFYARVLNRQPVTVG